MIAKTNENENARIFTDALERVCKKHGISKKAGALLLAE